MSLDITDSNSHPVNIASHHQEHQSLRLASSYYRNPTASAAAAALSSSTVPSTQSGPVQQLVSRQLSRALERHTESMYASSESHGQLLEGHGRGAIDKDDSNLCLVNAEQVEGTVVAIEDYTGGRFSPVVAPKDTFWPCTFNLSKVIMGAGMMAIPKAFNLLGLLPGVAIMLLMACLTFFTLASLVSATATTKAGSSYGMLVRKTVGGVADSALQMAVLANCYVMNIVFVVVLGDLLLGTAPEFAGLLPELLHMLGVTVDPATSWYLGRPLVLGLLSLLVLLPLSSMRSMEKLAVVNIVGVASNGLFAGLMLALAASAAANGQLQPPRLLPDLSQLGSSPVLVAISLASIVPVLLNCDVCHQSLHPLMPLLKPYSVGRMQRLVATALGICNLLYLTVTLCSGLVFGDALDADVLTNVNAASMAPLIGPAAGTVMAGLVWVGYVCSIMGSYVLLCYPLRQCIGDMLLPGGQTAVQQHWNTLTVLLVGSIYVIGCYLPSIWGALALIGATASTVQAFIIPGLVVLAVDRVASAKGKAATTCRTSHPQEADSIHAPLLSPAGPVDESAVAGAAMAAAPALAQDGSAVRILRRATAVFVILLGVLLFANGVVDSLWDTFHPVHDKAGSVDNVRNAGMGLMNMYRQMLTPSLRGLHMNHH